MISNKRGQTFITIIFLVIVFLIVWVMVMAEQISYWGHKVVVDYGLTGLEAFGFENINLMIFACLLLFLIVSAYFGGRG